VVHPLTTTSSANDFVNAMPAAVSVAKDVYVFLNKTSQQLDTPIAPDESRGCDAIYDQLMNLWDQVNRIIDGIWAARTFKELDEIDKAADALQPLIDAQRRLLQDCYAHDVGDKLADFTNSLDTSSGAPTGSAYGSGMPSASGVSLPNIFFPSSPSFGNFGSRPAISAPAPSDSGPLADVLSSLQQATYEIGSMLGAIEGPRASQSGGGYKFSPAPNSSSVSVFGVVQFPDGTNCPDCSVQICAGGPCTAGNVSGTSPTYVNGSFRARIPANLPNNSKAGVAVLNNQGQTMATAVLNLGNSNPFYTRGSQTSSSPFGGPGAGPGGSDAPLVQRTSFNADVTFSPPARINCPGEFPLPGVGLTGTVNTASISITLPVTIASQLASSRWNISGTSNWSAAISGCANTTAVTGTGSVGISPYIFPPWAPTVPIDMGIGAPDRFGFGVSFEWDLPLTATSFTGQGAGGSFIGSGLNATITLR
jgi:hypothetical protein